ncbi:MAG: hypothetical protein ACR2PH_04525 [Desulfobulbia bacterium]
MSNIVGFRDWKKNIPREQAKRHFTNWLKGATKSERDSSMTFDELHSAYAKASKGHKHAANEHEARMAIAKHGLGRTKIGGRERVLGITSV